MVLKQNKMNCAVWTGSEFKIEEKPIPEIGRNEILIKVAYTGICASDLHLMNDQENFPPPCIHGHEFSGTIEKVGSDITDFEKGDRVVSHPMSYCGECFFCRRGMEHLCENQAADPATTIFNPEGGAFKEYVFAKRRQVYHLPEEVSLKEGALVEPTAIAVHGIDISRVKSGESVLLMGAGPIGLLTLQMLKLSGACPIILSEPNQYRRDLGEKLGADIVINPLQDDLETLVRDVTDNRGIDICIEAAGLAATLEQGFDLLRRGGRLIVLSVTGQDDTIELNSYRINIDELEVKGSFFSPYSFDRAICMLDRLSLDQIITHTFDLEDINEAFKTHKESKKRIKILIEMPYI